MHSIRTARAGDPKTLLTPVAAYRKFERLSAGDPRRVAGALERPFSSPDPGCGWIAMGTDVPVR
jgi:hypothetical protein